MQQPRKQRPYQQQKPPPIPKASSDGLQWTSRCAEASNAATIPAALAAAKKEGARLVSALLAVASNAAANPAAEAAGEIERDFDDELQASEWSAL